MFWDWICTLPESFRSFLKQIKTQMSRKKTLLSLHILRKYKFPLGAAFTSLSSGSPSGDSCLPLSPLTSCWSFSPPASWLKTTIKSSALRAVWGKLHKPGFLGTVSASYLSSRLLSAGRICWLTRLPLHRGPSTRLSFLLHLHHSKSTSSRASPLQAFQADLWLLPPSLTPRAWA